MWKIPKRFGHFVFSVIQSGITCAIAAAVASTPFYADGTFATHWLRAYLYSWTIMLPVVLSAAPLVRKVVAVITR